MPVNHKVDTGWGRALGREHLDYILLNGAKRAGVDVIQPCSATGLEQEKEILLCTAKRSDSDINIELEAHVVIAAHGSWEKGNLPTHISRQKPEPSDLLGFKAHFTQTELPVDLMPLLAFPGGYGGMVHTDHGRVSLSCCIRRDVLQKRRNKSGDHHRASEAVITHILENCHGVQQTLKNAKLNESWLSAGPIRPGVHTLYKDGIFAAGNTAGEAHPVVAEGISMAMQGAWLLSELLLAGRAQVMRGNASIIGRTYSQAWLRCFKSRLHTAAVFAHLAMRPAATKVLLPFFQHIPDLLTVCTRLSGKTTNVITTHP
jgi:flavin-dependent dehydrogenase